MNCRIGSLENDDGEIRIGTSVNCRIGSLEKSIDPAMPMINVNCRIGSLENGGSGRHGVESRELPHRQLMRGDVYGIEFYISPLSFVR